MREKITLQQHDIFNTLPRGKVSHDTNATYAASGRHPSRTVHLWFGHALPFRLTSYVDATLIAVGDPAIKLVRAVAGQSFRLQHMRAALSSRRLVVFYRYFVIQTTSCCRRPVLALATYACWFSSVMDCIISMFTASMLGLPLIPERGRLAAVYSRFPSGDTFTKLALVVF